MQRYDLYILDSSKNTVAAMPDSAWEINETLNVGDTLNAVLFESDKFDLVTAENTYIRLVNADAATDMRTYRLTSVEQAHIDGRYALQCEGARIWADMGREIYEGWHPFKNIQVKTIVAELLGASAFQIKSGGDAESDNTIIESLDFAYTTVLEGLQRVAEAADLEIEIDESTSPESIDLKTRGASNNVHFEYGINTKGMARRFRRADVVNKVYPVGGGAPPATCEGALFEVYGVASTVVTVAGDKCIPSDDTYNTFKIEMVTGANAGTAYTINDTTRGSSGDDDTITLSTTPTGVAAGDLFKFTDASGNDLAYVPDAASQAAYGTFDGVVRDQQFEAIRTLITPGYMDGTYASGLHADWTKTGTPTVAEETSIDYIQHGKASQHVTAASDTHGIYYDVALDSSDYYSCAVNLHVVSGSVLVKITTTGATGAVEYKNQGGTSGTGWLTVTLEGLPIEGATATLTIAATGGAAEFYVDAVSFTGTQQTRQFVRENGARELYRMAFDYLDEHDAPMVEYDLPNALDLYAIDSAAYPFSDVAVGDTVTVVDPAMSLAASVRVLSLGRDSAGSKLRLKLSSHVSTQAAFSQVAPGAGRVILGNRRLNQDEIDQRRNNEKGAGIADRINRITGNAARSSRFTGSFTATGQTSFDIGSGTLYVGASLAYTIASQTISGLSGGSTYYLYLDPTAASSGLQTTTTAATAYAPNNIQVGIIATGATSNDNVQIYDTTGAKIYGEILTRGIEAYDTSGTKRIDVGIVQDPSASIGNPSDWGIQVTDGAHQTTSLLAEYTGSIPGAVRYLYVTFGDEDVDLTYATTTQKVYGDYVSMYAKSSADMIIGLYEGSLVSGSSGDLYGHQVSSVVNAGTGDATAFNIGSMTVSGGGHAYGLYVGSGSGVRSTSSGNAYGIYIGTVSSTSGTAYSIYDATTNRARFGGSLSVRGVDYVWPAADASVSGYVLSSDSAGTLSWVANSAGSLTGSGTTNYISKWTGASSLGDSLFYDDGTTASVGITNGASMFEVYKAQSDSTTDYKLSLTTDHGTTKSIGISLGRTGYDGADYSSVIKSVMSSVTTFGTTLQFQTHSTTTGVFNTGMLIDSSGNVGIGTGSPSSILHTYSGASSASVDTYAGITIENSSHATLNILTPDNADAGITWGTPTGGNFTSWVHHNYTSGYIQLATNYASGTMQFRTGSNALAMTIDTSGNVSINATAKLYLDGGSNTYIHEYGGDDVGLVNGGTQYFQWAGSVHQIVNGSAGTARIEMYGGIKTYDGSLNGVGTWYMGTGAHLGWTNGWALYEVSTGAYMRVNTSGWVGLGTNPSQKLHIYDGLLYVQSSSTTAQSYSLFYNSDASKTTYFGQDNSTGTSFGGDAYAGIMYSSSNLNFFPSATHVVTMTSAGVDITGTLTVSGASIVSGTGTADRVMKFTGTSTVGNSIIYESGTNIGINKSPIGQLQVHDSSLAMVAYFTTDGLNDTTIVMGTDYDGTPRNGVIGIDYSASELKIGYGSSLASAAIFVSSGNNVGIGGSATETLDVTGTFAVSSSATFGGGVDITSASPSLELIDTGAVGQIPITFKSSTSTTEGSVVLDMSTGWMSIGTTTSKPFYINTNSATAITVDTSQEVGINTTTPLSTLHVYDSGVGTSSGIRTENNAGSDWAMGEIAINNTWSLYDLGASDGRLNVKNDGDTGIGTMTPNYRLHVAKATQGYVMNIENSLGTKPTAPASMDILRLNYSSVTVNDTTSRFFLGVDNGTSRFEIFANGAMYNNGTYGTMSDMRLKRDIAAARSYWDDFKTLQYKTYKMIDEGEAATSRFGLVAQDVEVVFGRLVEMRPDGYKAVKSSIIGEIGNSVLIEAQKRIEALETENASLLARIETLEAA